MGMRKLSGTDGFVVVDLDDAPGLLRPRAAGAEDPPSGAREMARSATYCFASVGMQHSGASGGINARPEGRAAAVAAFVNESEPWVSTGEFLPDPGKGLTAADLAPLQVHDPRHPIRLRLQRRDQPQRAPGRKRCGCRRGRGARCDLEGRRIVIEGCGPAGVAAADSRRRARRQCWRGWQPRRGSAPRPTDRRASTRAGAAGGLGGARPGLRAASWTGTALGDRRRLERRRPTCCWSARRWAR